MAMARRSQTVASLLRASLLRRFSSRLSERSISSSAPRRLSFGWFDKVKSAFTGKPSPDSSASKIDFSLTEFADQMEKAKTLGSLKQFEVGRCSEATMSGAFQKNSAILRYLGAIDPSGENLQNSHKQDAAKHCNATIADVEHVLAKYSWAKEAQKKIEKLKEEGKPMPTSFSEVQKLMGSTPLDLGRSNLAKSGQISRNALCPCGSGKRYKRYDLIPALHPTGLWLFEVKLESMKRMEGRMSKEKREVVTPHFRLR
ncbi:hypothetical protein ZIOFF_053750 [Zingiber officinale]|uniref:Uncharacterized protein n=1 Tax=Zingiber officinale TaxID=94328 RepID=A0A8J5FDJ6_ZINOF|nr:hypothetical protein ZIOFF_053750 [Zingiber officinale]